MSARIQWHARQRGWRKPDGVVYVGRPTRWANPFDWREHGRVRAVELFRAHVAARPDLVEAARRELADKVLACWCPLNQPCHADVWLEVVS
jgi:hypothetical protein